MPRQSRSRRNLVAAAVLSYALGIHLKQFTRGGLRAASLRAASLACPLKRVAVPADQSRMEAVTFAGVFGAIFGSFLNVVAYRLPRHESLVTPGLALPRVRHAGQALRQHPDPLLAAAARALPQLRASRSRRATRSSRRSPPRSASAPCSRTDSAAGIALSIALILLVVPAALIDLEHRIIPNRITRSAPCSRSRSASRSTPPASPNG